MTIKAILTEIRKKLKGRLAVAKENGLVVEDGVTIMGGVDFGSEPYLIVLRKNCRISSDVLLITHDGGTWAFRNHWDRYKDVIKYGRIEIGEETFVGARSIIMPGVKIGRNCVVAAGSVVTKDVPDYTVVAGVPAKKISTTMEYAEKCFNAMPDNFDKEAYELNKKEYLQELIK